MKDIDLKLKIIQNHIKHHDIKITDLAIEAGYARPYLSSVLNQSKKANHGILDHLLQTLKIDYPLEKQRILSLQNLIEDIEYALLYNDIESAKDLYLQLEKSASIPLLIRNEVSQKIKFYSAFFNKQLCPEKNDLHLAYNAFLSHNFNKAQYHLNQLLAQQQYNKTYQAVFYLYLSKAYIHLDQLHLAQAHYHQASQLLIETRNYRRMVDAEIVAAKIYALNRELEKALLIYDTLQMYNTITTKQSDTIESDRLWSLIYNGIMPASKRIKENTSAKLAVIYLTKDSDPCNNCEDFKNTIEKMFCKLMTDLRSHQLETEILFEATQLYKKEYFSNVFFKRIYKSLLLECLTEKRLYKDAYELK
ncbi:MAG TPA: hypothetical protein VIG45_02650 [Erysipelothrix sp.]